MSQPDAKHDEAPSVEVPVAFNCGGETLVGVATIPPAPRPVGVLIVVGGPQVRAGSHRMFVLLARSLAEQGYASFRFDVRGMGDSSGDRRSFEQIDEDIQGAATAFRKQAPSVKRLAFWGLCDAASAALMSVGARDDVVGLVLANPWVRSEQSHNHALVRHYYARRLLQAEFWRRLFSGGVRVRDALAEFSRRLGGARQAQKPGAGAPGGAPFRERMLRGWRAFPGRRLVILSGRDLTAREFDDLAATDGNWSLERADGLVSVLRIDEADHTFSSAVHRAAVARATADFLSSLPPA